MKNRIPKYIQDDMDSDICLKRRGRGGHDVLVREDGDLAIENSWIKYKEDNKKIGMPAHHILKLREFKQEIGEKMILDNIYRDENEIEHNQENENPNKKRGRPGSVPLPPDAKRFHAANHLPDMSTKQNRCRNFGCSKKTTVTCIYCNLPLCITPKRNCFIEFHKK
ncbi:unnamed protein product [Euphydryas editha]|uniref:Uncharacterized protein n=1 Tax=Euphydryas editha TaxID=104508 RepID=A0AAU9UP35_EUPED|nr:unnamed protein product [Euphydryas editha]